MNHRLHSDNRCIRKGVVGAVERLIRESGSMRASTGETVNKSVSSSTEDAPMSSPMTPTIGT